MPKMTAKYAAALSTARREQIPPTDHQEELYGQLQALGWWWNSDRKEWEHHEPAEADEPTPFIAIRVWADEEVVQEAADDISAALKRRGWTLLERAGAYRCHPPKQREARIYLRFLPKGKEIK